MVDASSWHGLKAIPPCLEKRKRFTLGKEGEGERVFVDFDGAMAYADLWVNGASLGGWP